MREIISIPSSHLPTIKLASNFPKSSHPSTYISINLSTFLLSTCLLTLLLVFFSLLQVDVLNFGLEFVPALLCLCAFVTFIIALKCCDEDYLLINKSSHMGFCLFFYFGFGFLFSMFYY